MRQAPLEMRISSGESSRNAEAPVARTSWIYHTFASITYVPGVCKWEQEGWQSGRENIVQGTETIDGEASMKRTTLVSVPLAFCAGLVLVFAFYFRISSLFSTSICLCCFGSLHGFRHRPPWFFAFLFVLLSRHDLECHSWLRFFT